MTGRVSSLRGAVEITRQGEDPVIVPVADVAVLIVGIRVSFSSAAMHRLLENDIAVLFCDWKGVPEGAAYPNNDHSRVGARHLAQVNLSLPRKKNAWGRIVKAKVMGQAKMLQAQGLIQASDLTAMAHEVRSGDPANVEARAARVYWQALSPQEQFRRVPGRGKEGEFTRNAHLDYAYTILRGHGIRAVMGAGLSPAMGVFHRGRSNYFSLVDDLMEPYRPAVDAAVFEIASDAPMEDPEVRHHLVGAASRVFTVDGMRIPASFAALAQQYGRYVEGDLAKLDVESWCGVT